MSVEGWGVPCVGAGVPCAERRGALCQQKSALCPVQRRKVTAGTESSSQWAVQMQKRYLIFPVTFTEMENHRLTFRDLCRYSHRPNDLCRDGKALLDLSCDLYSPGMKSHHLTLHATFTEMENHHLTFSATFAEMESHHLTFPVTLAEMESHHLAFPVTRAKTLVSGSRHPSVHSLGTPPPPQPCYICLVCRNTVGPQPGCAPSPVTSVLSAGTQWVHSLGVPPALLHLSCLQEHSGSRAYSTDNALYRASTFNDWPHLTAIYWLVSWLNGHVVVCVVHLIDRLILFCVVLC